MGFDQFRPDVDLVFLYAEIWGYAESEEWKKKELGRLLGGIDPAKFATYSPDEQDDYLKSSVYHRQQKREEIVFLLRDEIDSSLEGFKHDRAQANTRIEEANAVLDKETQALDEMTAFHIKNPHKVSSLSVSWQEKQIQTRMDESSTLRDKSQNLLVSAAIEEKKFFGYYKRLMDIAREMHIQLRANPDFYITIER
jgi:hypothetical protein